MKSKTYPKILFFILLLVIPFYSNAQLQWSQFGLDIDGETLRDQSGHSVSINAAGDRVAIGAYRNGNNTGHVRIYEWNGIAWIKLGNDIDGEEVGDWFGFSVSLNGDGERLAVGAIFNNGNGNSSGHVRIYEFDSISADWNQLGTDIEGEDVNDFSGQSVSFNKTGDRLAIGARANDGNGSRSGHVRIYEWDTTLTDWVQFGGDIDGEALNDQSGYSVSMNAIGDRLAIGAIGNDGKASEAGHVRIFEWDSTSWVQLGTDRNGEAAGDESGSSVSMNASGDLVAIGSPLNNGNGTNAGQVRIFKWDGTAWSKVGSDIDGEAAGDNFGISVSMNASGNRIAIGATENNGNNGIGSFIGHARIYAWDSTLTSWIQIGADIDGEADRDHSGFSVSMDSIGDRLAIGARNNDGNGNESGHVRVYNYGPPCRMTATFSAQTNVSCLGGNNGSITVAVDSGEAKYSYVWSDSTLNLKVSDTFNTISGLVAGNYTVTITDANSCTTINSAIIINLDTIGPINDTSIVTGCQDYFWAQNNQTYLKSGIYSDTSLNALGCDSVYHFLDLTINFSSRSIDTIVACDSIVWRNGITYFADNILATDTLANNLGCDSIISLNLSIIKLDLSVVNLGDSIYAFESGNSYQWLDCDADTIIPSAIAIGFKPDTTGNYAVIIDNGVCSDTSVCNLVRVVGLEENINDFEFRIFPNPTHEYITIESQNLIEEIAQITNITGALLLEFKITQEKETIDLSGFQNGLYFLRVGNQTQKIIVAR